LKYYNPSSYMAVFRRGIDFFRALGWKRTMIIQGLGLLSSGLYALGLASLVPVLNMFNGTKTPLPAAINNILRYIPAIQQHNLTGLVLLTGTLLIFLLRSGCLSFYYGYGGRTTEDYTRHVRNKILDTYAYDREHYAAEMRRRESCISTAN